MIVLGRGHGVEQMLGDPAGHEGGRERGSTPHGELSGEVIRIDALPDVAVVLDPGQRQVTALQLGHGAEYRCAAGPGAHPWPGVAEQGLGVVGVERSDRHDRQPEGVHFLGLTLRRAPRPERGRVLRTGGRLVACRADHGGAHHAQCAQQPAEQMLGEGVLVGLVEEPQRQAEHVDPEPALLPVVVLLHQAHHTDQGGQHPGLRHRTLGIHDPPGVDVGVGAGLVDQAGDERAVPGVGVQGPVEWAGEVTELLRVCAGVEGHQQRGVLGDGPVEPRMSADPGVQDRHMGPHLAVLVPGGRLAHVHHRLPSARALAGVAGRSTVWIPDGFLGLECTMGIPDRVWVPDR